MHTFVMLNGPSCAGKSTLCKRVLAENEGWYHLSYDAQKWQISKYAPDKHYNLVQRIVRALAQEMCAAGYNIVCDSALYREHRELLLAIARSHHYRIIEVNLDAPWNVLESRFHARVSDAQKNNSKRISNTSPVRFEELYDIYNREKNTDAIVLNSASTTAEDLYAQLEALL